MEVYVNIGTTHWERKPREKEVGIDSSQVMANGSRKMSIEDFAKEIAENGKTCMLAKYHGKSKSRLKTRRIVSQDMIMLDFDNKDDDVSKHYTVEDLKKDPFMNEQANFFYYTFSHLNSNVDKFRVVFVLDRQARTNDEVSEIYSLLLKKYPQADSSIGQANRLFYGTISGYYEINFKNKLTNSVYHTHKENESISSNYRQEYIDKLENFNASQPVSLPDRVSALKYMKQVNIREVFGIEYNVSFKDILHEEKNSSASIYLDERRNEYIYKCFSDSKKFHGNIIALVSELKNFTPEETFDYLTDKFKINITYSSELGIFEKHWFGFIDKIKDDSLKEEYPYLAKYLNYYNSLICSVMPRLTDFTRIDEGKLKYINFHSNISISKALFDYEGVKISVDRVRVIMTTLSVLEIYSKKSSWWEIQGLESGVKYKNFLIPQLLDENSLRNAETIAKRLIEANITKRNLSFETIYREFGEEKAKRDFNQIEAHLQTMKKSKVDSKLSSTSVTSERATIKELSKYFEENNYIPEKELIRLASRRLSVKRIVFENAYKKFRASILSNYGYERVSLTKEIHTRLGLEGKCTREIIIVKTNYEEE